MFQIVRLMIVLLLCMVVSGATCAWAAGTVTAPAATQPTTRALLTPRSDVAGVGNFAKVSEALYRGQQPTPDGFKELKAMGIKTVVNLRSFHSDRDDLKGTGLRYAHIYCKAWHPEDEDLVQFLKIVQDPANQPVFVHCQHGADRTGCAVAVYRIVEEGWSIDDAVKELNNFGFHPVWTEIKEYLEHFDAEAMKPKLKDAPAAKVEVVP